VRAVRALCGVPIPQRRDAARRDSGSASLACARVAVARGYDEARNLDGFLVQQVRLH